VISNQSGIARGLLTPTQVDSVNTRLAELLGPLGPVLYCPHHSGQRCRCRKPQPGLVLDAAAALDVDPQDCVVIGDIAADLGAAVAAGARGVLVPTEMTRQDEVAAAHRSRALAPDLCSAVDLVLTGALPDGTVLPLGAAGVAGAAA
jgi:histidinol phosphatase-like enzyme